MSTEWYILIGAFIFIAVGICFGFYALDKATCRLEYYESLNNGRGVERFKVCLSEYIKCEETLFIQKRGFNERS